MEAVRLELHSQEGADFLLDKEAQKRILRKPETDTLSKTQMTMGRREAVGQERSFLWSRNGS